VQAWSKKLKIDDRPSVENIMEVMDHVLEKCKAFYMFSA
jgi:hypothetical protein